MTLEQIEVVLRGMERIRHRLFKVSQATSRKRTPGRVKVINNGDDLSSWFAHDLESAKAIGVSLTTLSDAARDQIDKMLRTWDNAPT